MMDKSSRLGESKETHISDIFRTLSQRVKELVAFDLGPCKIWQLRLR